MISAIEVWNLGVPLNVALWQFSDPATREKHDQQTKMLQSPKAFADSVAGQTGKHQFPDVEKHPIAQITYAGAALIHMIWGNTDLQIDVSHKLQSRRLIAAGYHSPRRLDDQPQIIPFDVWEGDIDWKASTVTGNGLTFFSVRVAPPMRNTPKTIEHEPTSILPMARVSLHRSRGRPGVEAFISSAYEALNQRGLIDQSKPRTASYPLIRALLADTHPADAKRYRSLSDKTLARHTKALFERDKKAGTKL